MDFTEFKESLGNSISPADINELLTALWHEGKNDWEKAHEIVQNRHDKDGVLIHAFLHRKEGDLVNAGYWYQKGGKKMPDYSLGQEWEELVRKEL